MGVVAIKMKIMPASPETDMKKLEEKIKEELEKEDVKNPSFEIEPIAFGLKALIVLFGWPEEKELEKMEEKLRKVENVNSAEIIDMRRAVG